jgi:hypothetical protein
MPRTKNLEPNLAAFLDMIAVSEIGPKLLSKSDDGYNVVVGVPYHATMKTQTKTL